MKDLQSFEKFLFFGLKRVLFGILDAVQKHSFFHVKIPLFRAFSQTFHPCFVYIQAKYGYNKDCIGVPYKSFVVQIFR